MAATDLVRLHRSFDQLPQLVPVVREHLSEFRPDPGGSGLVGGVVAGENGRFPLKHKSVHGAREPERQHRFPRILLVPAEDFPRRTSNFNVLRRAVQEIRVERGSHDAAGLRLLPEPAGDPVFG